MYKIRDLQFDIRYFGGGNGIIFENKEEIIEQLADYHDIDYEGVKDNDESYEDIWEFLNTLKNDTEILNWLLEYGQWEIEEIRSECCNAEIINHGFDIVSLLDKNFHLECKKCNKMYELLIDD